MAEITIVTLSFTTVGVLFVGFGVPLFQRRIPPNIWYGCRTRKSLSDKNVWFDVNETMGRDMIVTGVVVLIATIFIFFARHKLSEHLMVLIPVAATILGVVRMLINSLRALSDV
jgi:uncharacterized membrane protein